MAKLALTEITTAATLLMRAARWDAAAALLRATDTDDPAERRALQLGLAEVLVDHDFARQTDSAGPALAALGQTLEQLPDETTSWDLGMLNLRRDYAIELFSTASEAAAPGTDGRDRGAAQALADRAADLRQHAPDDARRGSACFYSGLIADNLLSDHKAAFGHYTATLELGERSGDDLLASLALRHLGDHAHTAGDLQLARTHWERSTELRQKVGHLLGALAQQAVLAVLLHDEGNPVGARTLATEINRWSRQVDIPFITDQTGALMK